MSPAQRASVSAELDRAGTPDDALARRLLEARLERGRRDRLTNHELEAMAAEDRLDQLERGR